MNYKIYQEMSNVDKNKLVKQYECLINKIIGQFLRQGYSSYEDLLSMAYEGFMRAIKDYDEERSSQNFTQFAAYSIRFHILNSISYELRTVRMSQYNQKKAEESGLPLFNTVRFNNMWDDDKLERNPILKDSSVKLEDDRDCKYEDIYEYLYIRLEEKFSPRDCQIFYMSFGLKDYEETTGKDIAIELGISQCGVSNKLKRIVEYIRKDNDLCEMLAKL